MYPRYRSVQCEHLLPTTLAVGSIARPTEACLRSLYQKLRISLAIGGQTIHCVDCRAQACPGRKR